MKRIVVIVLVLIALAAGGFFLYTWLTVKGIVTKNDSRELKTEWMTVSFPKGWEEPVSEEYSYNYGGISYKIDREGVGEFAGVQMAFYFNENPEDQEADWLAGETIGRYFNPAPDMPSDTVEFFAEAGEDDYDTIQFQGVQALRRNYIIKSPPFDDEEAKKNPRGSFKKGEIILFPCSGRVAMIIFETFEEHWDKHQKMKEEILNSSKLTCTK